MNTKVAENLKTTIEKVESYALAVSSSAVVFVVLSFANVKDGDVVHWELLGFPLDFSPPFALIVLYLLYFFACLLVDNMVIHICDLAAKLNRDEVIDILGYPSILTVSPLASILTTVVPAILIIGGLGWIHTRGTYQLSPIVWGLAYGLGSAGFWVFVRFYRSVVVPYLPDWLTSPKKDVQTPKKQKE